VALGQIVAAIDALAPTRIVDRAYRHQAVRWRYSPPGAGARTVGGRWNPPNSFATLYLGLTTRVVEAEFRRLADQAGRSPSDFMPRDVLEYEVELEAVLDLTGSEALAAVGLSETLLLSDDPTPCQQVGEAAHHLGREALLAPSVTGEGSVLAVFLERLLPASRVEIVSTTDWTEPP
jgi:RES domain-containing protein